MNNIVSLVVYNLTVTQCGALVSTTHGTVYNSAFSILQCMDTEVSRLILKKNIGIGLAILNHRGGLVYMNSSQFLKNIPKDCHGNSSVVSGGGIYIGGYEQDPSDPINFKFENCTFGENVAYNKHYEYFYINDVGKSVSGYGFGGGAAVHLDRGLTDIHVIFTQCKFSRNKAFVGGGLASVIGASGTTTRNVSITVSDSVFENNGYNKTAKGGGMYIQLDDSSDTFSMNEVLIHGVNFTHNCAEFGGGLKLYSYPERSEILVNKMEFKDCTFDSNTAHAGSAIDITPNILHSLSNGFLVIPVIKDCTFSRNAVRPNKYDSHATFGIGTLYISLYNVKLEGFNNFESNIGTAIHVVNGNINMSQSNVNFLGNNGIQGGAIALIGYSSMIVGPNRRYKFINNTALDKGGALYVHAVSSQNIIALKKCFVRYHDADTHVSDENWKVLITFTDNRAFTGLGHAIFATTFFSCQMNNSMKMFGKWGITVERNSAIEGLEIATEGSSIRSNNNPLKVIPGEQFTHGVTIKDDFNQRVKEVLSAATWNFTNIVNETSFFPCIEEFMTLKGKPNETIKLYLQTATSRLSYIRLDIEFIDCPPGFFYNPASSKCDCNNLIEYAGLVKCNETMLHSYLYPGYWAGIVGNSNELITSYCPVSFCNYNYSHQQGSLIRLPDNYTRLDEAMCGKSRTGVACGECVPGYTTLFHSPNSQCRRVNPALCKVGWLFYLLSELMPVTIVFITVLIFNLNFTSGTVNGFILFSQVLNTLDVNASGLITFPPPIGILMEGYKLFYGPFSLNFFQIEPLSFCLWPNASALDMVAFKYVTIIYALLLVLLVIWFMNKCGARCWRITTIKSSVIHGLSAFLILCYSQCVRISLLLLNSFPLYIRRGTALRRVWLNGNITSFSGNHLLYALPAMFCLLTIGIIPPILLLAYPLSNRFFAIFNLEDSKLLKLVSISSFKPLLDSFQGCFKDNLRFFAGLYFLYRWINLTVSILPSIGYGRAYVVQGAFITITLALHAVCQPYSFKKHNVIDTLLFTDLILINAITFLHYHSFHASAENHTGTKDIVVTAVIQLILVYLPFLVMLIYVLVQACRLGYKQYAKNHSTVVKSTWLSLSIFNNLIGKGSHIEEEELPHRLLADDIDYKHF